MIWSELNRAIESNETFLISSHINPDGDCIGAQLAFRWYLESLGKKVVIYDKDSFPEKFMFLDGSDRISTDYPDYNIDVLVVLDASNLDRLGWECNADGYPTIINIDHHQDNTRFATVNVVDDKASSTGEVLSRYFEDNKIVYPKYVAEFLYVAVMTDTGGFRFTNTNGNVLSTCAILANHGVNCSKMYRNVYASYSPNGELLRAKIYSTMKYYLDNRVCSMEYSEKIVEELGAGYGDSEGMADNTINATGVDVGMLIKYSDVDTHFSLRSSGTADVGKIARHFGGGGHRGAAGCSIEALYDEALDEMIEFIKNELKV